jgi:hypothetical protein
MTLTCTNVRTPDQSQVFFLREVSGSRLCGVKEGHTPLMWRHLPTFNNVSRHSLDSALTSGCDFFDDIVVMEARAHIDAIVALWNGPMVSANRRLHKLALSVRFFRGF